LHNNNFTFTKRASSKISVESLLKIWYKEKDKGGGDVPISVPQILKINCKKPIQRYNISKKGVL